MGVCGHCGLLHVDKDLINQLRASTSIRFNGDLNRRFFIHKVLSIWTKLPENLLEEDSNHIISKTFGQVRRWVV